ncbi:MAG: DUF3169 family protein [Lachnospiraceae bacterium]|nr:DUF3169 family protein [Lachnospiraceae bacterium]
MKDNIKVNAEALNEEDDAVKNIVSNEVKERKAEIKQEDNKKIGQFILICVISGIVGGIIGAAGIFIVVLLERSGMSFVNFWNQLQKDFTVPASILMIVLDILFFIIGLVYYSKGKKIWKSNIDEDEKYETADRNLSLSLMYSNILYYVNFAFFGFAMYASMSLSDSDETSVLSSVLRLVILVVFMAALYAGLGIQKACVNQTKLMNPEKKGSVYDMKFDKVWYESCDEAERMQIGIAGYKTVKTVNVTLLVLMVVFVCAAMFFEIGILPIAVIAIIAFVANITYSITAMNAGKQ